MFYLLLKTDTSSALPFSSAPPPASPSFCLWRIFAASRVKWPVLRGPWYWLIYCLPGLPLFFSQ